MAYRARVRESDSPKYNSNKNRHVDNNKIINIYNDLSEAFDSSYIRNYSVVSVLILRYWSYLHITYLQNKEHFERYNSTHILQKTYIPMDHNVPTLIMYNYYYCHYVS